MGVMKTLTPQHAMPVSILTAAFGDSNFDSSSCSCDHGYYSSGWIHSVLFWCCF